MNRGGAAYLAYRVPTERRRQPACRPATSDAETRVARYNGSLWSVLGVAVEPQPAVAGRQPDGGELAEGRRSTSPATGIVAFQEPDDEFVDRIWARRIFGSTLGIPLIVSPQTWAARRCAAPADALRARRRRLRRRRAVAFRQQPGERSALDRPARVREHDPRGVPLRTPARSGGPRAGRRRGARGARQPGGAERRRGGERRVPGGRSESARLRSRPRRRPGSTCPSASTTGGSAVAGDPVVELADSEASVAAWKLRLGSRAGAGIREQRTRRQVTRRTVSAAAGGAVNDLRLAGSGFGDAIVAFQQGGPGAAQVGAALVDAPPQRFAVETRRAGCARGE